MTMVSGNLASAPDAVDLVERRREGERGVIDSVRGAGEIARDHGHCLAPPEIACRDA